MTFFSTWHLVSSNIHIPCSFSGSSTIFLLFFKMEFDAILLLKYEIGHKKIIFFNQKKNHLQKTKLEKVFLKNTRFSLEQHGDELIGRCIMNLKKYFLDWKFPR